MIPYLLAGMDVLKKAVLGIIHRQMLDESFLMTIASIGAFVTMNKAINAGDVEQANLSANKVRKVFWISLILCIVFVVLYIVLITAGVIAASR